MSNNMKADKDVDQAKKPKESQIPVLSPSHFKRTGSLKLKNESRPPRIAVDSSTPNHQLRRHRSLQGLASPVSMRSFERSERDEDLDSERSYGSSCNSLCGHSPFAHNGTTYSARNMKYIFHCSPNAGSEEYLTPTQRANRTIRRLRRMLTDAQSELIEKESEVCRLTKELVELRLLKADDPRTGDDLREFEGELDYEMPAAHSKTAPRFMDVLPEELDNVDANIVQVGEQTNPTTNNQPLDYRGVYPPQVHHSPSLADSGNYEDINCSLAHTLEKDLEKLHQNYEEMREKHNEKVEELLKIIADSNDKYYDMKPKYDTAVIKIKELEKQVESLQSSAAQHEEFEKTMYLQFYAKQEKSEKLLSDLEKSTSCLEETSSNKKDVADLMSDLAVTKKELESVKDNEYESTTMLSAKEAISLWILGTRKVMYRALLEASKLKTVNDAEMTLRFLKNALFYYLTDTSNCKDHLVAIESILGFTEEEKAKIEKVQSWKY